MSESFDAHAPQEIARRVRSVGVAKARLDGLTLLVLGVLAGAFIGLGALFSIVVATGSELGYGVTRLLAGLAFSLGLLLVVVAGAELFTGNNLVVMAWASRRITLRELLRNWGIVYVGNVVGAVLTAALVAVAGVHGRADGAVGEMAQTAAFVKASLGAAEAFALAVLCNALVCLAVWLASAGRSVTDKVLAVVFPITAFVAIGFEHCVANWWFLPYAAMVGDGAPDGFLGGAARNLVVVTAGNVVGGAGLVAAVYWVAYLRNDASDD